MESLSIYNRLKDRFDTAIKEFKSDIPQPFIKVDPEVIREVCVFLKSHPDLSFNTLMCLSGVDGVDYLYVVYHLYSLKHHHSIIIKVELEKKSPVLMTVEDVWKGANWFERETYDLFGITFERHPDLRRILLPQDWHGHPLLKDYQEPIRYEGMDLRREYPTKKLEVKS